MKVKMKGRGTSTYEQARETMMEKLEEQQKVLERKIFFGVVMEFTVEVVADPSCKGCHGSGVEMESGVSGKYESYEVICHCASQRKIIRRNLQ